MSLMKKLASVLVTASLVFGLVGTAFAAPAPDKVAEGANRLHALGIVNGSDAAHPDDLQLDQQITRAQLMKIMVWAFGQRDNAAILKGAQAFPDTASHWASGEIAIAKNIIVEKNHETMGMPDGTFSPDGKVTNAQAVAFLMKFIGVRPDTTKTWPNNYLDAAVASGMLSASDVESIAPIANNPATRGIVFYLSDVAFSSYNMASGKTVYTTYVKPAAPVLNVEAPVANTTDKSITINGSVGSDAVSLTVNGSAVKPAADGKFTATVDLKIGSNTITVVATDIVKGATTKTFTVSRTVGAAAKIDVSPATVSVAAGASVAFKATISDKDGNVLDAQADVTSDAGTYAQGQFTANTAVGTGTITVKYGELTAVSVPVSIVAGALDKIVISPATLDLAAGGTQKFTATGADAHGNAVAISNVAWTSDKGVMGADGTLAAPTGVTGTVTLTATANGKSSTATINVFGTPAKVQIAAPSSIVANGVSETTVSATVLDANGLVVKGYNGPVTFASSNGNAVKVKTATVNAVNGVATTTLTAGASATATVLSASAANINGTTVSFTPAKQAATSFTLTADQSTLAAAAGSQSTLKVKMLDQTGNALLAANIPSTTYKVKLTSSDKTVVYFGANLDNTELTLAANGDYVTASTPVFAAAKVGGVTITGTVTAPTSSTLAVNPVSINTLVVGAPYQIAVDDIASKKAGANVTVTFRVLDFNGNQLTALAAQTDKFTAKIYNTASSTTPVQTINGTIDTLLGGVGSFTFSNTATDTYTVTVSGTADQAGLNASGNPATITYALQSASKTVVITPEVANRITAEVTPGTLQANGSSTGAIKISITDRYTNPVTDGTYAVKVVKSGDNKATAAFADTTVNTVNGEATITVTATTLESSDGDTFTFTATGLNGTTATVKTAIFGAPYQVDFVTSSTTYTHVDTVADAKAGSTKKVYVAVKDANPTGARTVTSDNNRVITVNVKDGDGNIVGSYTGNTTNGVATVTLTNPTTTGQYKLEAKADGLATATIAPSDAHPTYGLAVVPAGVAQLVVTADRGDLAADGSKATLTVKMVDANGNAVKAPASGTKVYLKLSTNGDYGVMGSKITDAASAWLGWTELTIAADASSVTTSDSATVTSFVANSAGFAGTETIIARYYDTTAGVQDGNISIATHTTYNTVTQVSVDAISSATASTAVANGVQKIQVRLLDPAGTLLTSKTDSVVLTITGGKTGSVTVYQADKATAINAVADANGKPTYTNAAVKGIVTFYVIDDKADTLSYSAQAKVGGQPVGTAVTTSGTFTAGEVVNTGFGVSVTPTRINGNGIDPATVTIKLVDAAGNTVPTASGTLSVAPKALSGSGDYVTVQQSTVEAIAGEASVVLQAKALPSNLPDKTISLTVGYDFDKDGVIEDAEKLSLNDILTVDTTNPTANAPATPVTITAVNYASGNAFKATATASDSASATLIDSVLFQYKEAVNGVWADLGNATYSAGTWTITATPGWADNADFVLRTIATDKVGRSTTSAETTFKTHNGAPTAVVAAAVGSTTYTVTFTDAMGMAGAGVAANYTATKVAAGQDLTVSSVAYDATTKIATVTVSRALVAGDVVGVGATVTDGVGNAIAAPVTLTVTP